MKKFTKVLFTCTAIAAMAVASTTAMAAGLNVTYNEVAEGPDTITIAAYESTGEQQTLLVVPAGTTTVTDADIKQIDQQAGAFTTVTVGDLADGTYEVRIGGDTAATFLSGTFKVGQNGGPSTRLLGDVDGSTTINVSDATKVVNHVLGSETLVEGSDDFKAADADKNGTVNVSDATQIVNFVLGADSLIDGTTTIQ